MGAIVVTAATGHGITAREAAMVDLWDAGRSMEQIGRELGIGRKTVSNRIKNLCFNNGLAEHRRHCAAMRAGSAALAEAILREASPAEQLQRRVA